VQQRRGLKCALSAAENEHALVAEAIEGAVVSRVGDEIRGQ
jgi:hypothetical protein